MEEDYFDLDNAKRLIIHGTVLSSRGEIPIAILIDTGCDISGIASSSIDRLGVRPRRMANPMTNSLADGSRSQTTHESDVKVRVGTYTTNVYVTIINGTLTPHDMLLGMDWIIKADPKVSFNPLSFKVKSGGREHELTGIRPDGDPFFCIGHGYANPEEHPQKSGRSGGRPRRGFSPGSFGWPRGSNDGHDHNDDCERDDERADLEDFLSRFGGMGGLRERFPHGHPGSSPFWTDFGPHGGRHGHSPMVHKFGRHHDGFPRLGGHCHARASHCGCPRARNHNSGSQQGRLGSSRSGVRCDGHQARDVVCAARVSRATTEPVKRKWMSWRDVFGVREVDKVKTGKSSKDEMKVYRLPAVKPLKSRRQR